MPLDLQARRDIARILDDAFALYRAHWRTLLAVSAAIVIPVQVGVLGLGLGWLFSDYDSTRPQGEVIAGVASQLFVVTPLVTAMVIRVVVEAAAGQRTSTSEVITSGLELFPKLFWAIVLVALGVFGGFLAFVVPAVFLAVRWCVVPQAVVIDGARGTEALRRSWSLVQGRGWWTLAALVVANLLTTVLSVVFTVPGRLLARAVDAEAVNLAGGVLGQIATLPLLGIATTLLYFTLRAGDEAESVGPVAPTPTPTPAIDPITSEPISDPVPSEPVAADAWERRRREGWEPPSP